MFILLLGLFLFLGAHSVRIYGDGLRAGFIARSGEGAWKGLYALVSLAGLGLIIYGYGQARYAPALYPLPAGLAHLTFVLVPLAFICVIAAYWPANHIKAFLGDPMVAGVGLWALGHLLVKATPAAVLLFGAFLVWAAADYLSLRRRRAGAPPPGPKPRALNTILVIVSGVAAGGIFAMALHKLLIGVAPMG